MFLKLVLAMVMVAGKGVFSAVTRYAEKGDSTDDDDCWSTAVRFGFRYTPIRDTFRWMAFLEC